MNWIKGAALNLLVVIISIVVILLMLNVPLKALAPQILSQKLWPRALAAYLPDHYKTFYPATNDGHFHDWTAVLGDSYAAGQGDGYLENVYDYSAVHFLRQHNQRNYYIFGRSGFGSVNAVKEYFLMMDELQNSWFYPVTEHPQKILLFFYEGNDLNNNLKHWQQAKSGQTVEEFIDSQIGKGGDFQRKRRNLLPIFDLLAPKVFRNIWFPKHGKPSVIGNTMVFNGQPKEYGGAPQSAAAELSDDQLDQSLQVFFASLNYLKQHTTDIDIELIYIPSVVSFYNWQTPLRVQSYQNKQPPAIEPRDNAERSRFIRQAIKNYCQAQRIQFSDSSDYFQNQASQNYLHGIRDPKHLSIKGYQLLGDFLLRTNP